MKPTSAVLAQKLQQLERLYSAVVADVLDQMGYRWQSIGGDIRPLNSAQKVCGRIFTAQAKVVDADPAEPYKLELEAIDTMQAGDVFLVDGGGDRSCAFWGELLTTACLAKGVRGIVMTACTRDHWNLRNLDFPVFGLGFHPADSKGRLDVVTLGEPIQFAGIAAHSGDYLIGDVDGVVIIPAAAVDEVLRRANEKVTGENTVREELARGIPAREVFSRHGIL
ncbi:MAG: RraA family protein [Pedosphaera sp.]|nr:RraA family protein [Pedosphaera sp.]